jgi:Phytanoyl-CoA dioxygenase (PhyH)
VCYFASDPGVPMTGPAGTIVCFSSVVMHRSGPNLTEGMRRVYVTQYSHEVIMNKAGSEPHGFFERFLDNGEVVARI